MAAAAAASIYKIVPADVWRAAEAAGRFSGAGVDLTDGYIHLSSAAQVRATAARHFASVTNLVLVAVDPEAVTADLRWEPARGGELFPHLRADLPMRAVRWVEALPLDADGQHRFPPRFDRDR